MIEGDRVSLRQVLLNLVVNVFDPFFTTKEQGIRLGPVIAQSIVGAHGGTIWASDHRPRGATFHVQLPLSLASPVVNI